MAFAKIKCLALLGSAKHWSDSQDVALRIPLSNKEVLDGQSTFEIEATWGKRDHKIK